MKMDRAILFSVFDRTKGPVPIYIKGEAMSLEEIKKIAFRSQMTLSMMESANIESAEAILPLSDLKKIVFIYLFMIHQNDPKEPKCVAALSYIVPNDQQIFLYSKVPYLKIRAEDISKIIIKDYLYADGVSIPPHVADEIDKLLLSEEESSGNIEIIEKKVVISPQQIKSKGSIELLLNQVKKNEDKAIAALLRGDTPVLVVGSPDLVDYTIQSLELFLPHMIIKKVPWTTKYVDPSMVDIIGMPKEITKYYPGKVVINLEKGRVEGGKNSNYIKKLIKDVRKNQSEAKSIIDERIKELIQVSSELVEAFQLDENERNTKVTEIQKKYSPDLVEAAAEFAAHRNPLIRDILLEKISERFLDWMDEL